MANCSRAELLSQRMFFRRSKNFLCDRRPVISEYGAGRGGGAEPLLLLGQPSFAHVIARVQLKFSSALGSKGLTQSPWLTNISVICKKTTKKCHLQTSLPLWRRSCEYCNLSVNFVRGHGPLIRGHGPLIPPLRTATGVLTAFYWTSHLPCCWRSHVERPTGRRHLSTISSDLQKTTKTASVSALISWPSFIHQLFLCVVLVVAACYLGHIKHFLLD